MAQVPLLRMLSVEALLVHVLRNSIGSKPDQQINESTEEKRRDRALHIQDEFRAYPLSDLYHLQRWGQTLSVKWSLTN